MSKRQVLLIDDDADLRRVLALVLRREGYGVHEAGTVAEAREALATAEPDVVLADLHLPDGSGLELVRDVRAAAIPAAVLVFTGQGTIEAAVEALQLGADHFLTKPVEPEVLIALVRKAEESLILRRQVLASAEEGSAAARLQETQSEGMRRVVESLPALAESESNVLITGESGTGKSLLARALHEMSPRASKPFVELNCSSLSRELLESELFGHSAGAFTGATRAKQGLIEVADTGTLFLDEIGDMDLSVQPKLLKVIEDGQIRRLGSVQTHSVDVRVVAATHFDLDQRSRDGEFRHDLYYRLDVLHVTLPPLRERQEDIPELAKSFLAERRGGRAGSVRGFSPDAMEWLQAQAWPGNIRELRNLVERAAVYAGEGLIRREHFGGPARSAPPAPASAGSPDPSAADDGSDPSETLTLEEVEKRHVGVVLAAAGGRRTEAARRLGITRQTLLRKIRTYRLEARDEE